MYATGQKFAYTCLTKSSAEQIFLPVDLSQRLQTCPKIASSHCEQTTKNPVEKALLLLRLLYLCSGWLPLKPSLFLSLFLSFSPPSHFHFFTLSLVCLDKQAPSTFLTGALSLSKNSSPSKNPRQRPSLPDRRSGRHWAEVSVCAVRPPVLGPTMGSQQPRATSPTIPAHVPQLLPSSSNSLSVRSKQI